MPRGWDLVFDPWGRAPRAGRTIQISSLTEMSELSIIDIMDEVSRLGLRRRWFIVGGNLWVYDRHKFCWRDSGPVKKFTASEKPVATAAAVALSAPHVSEAGRGAQFPVAAAGST